MLTLVVPPQQETKQEVLDLPKVQQTINEIYQEGINEGLAEKPLHLLRVEMTGEVASCFGQIKRGRKSPFKEFDHGFFPARRFYIDNLNAIYESGYSVDAGETYTWADDTQTNFDKDEISVSDYAREWAEYKWVGAQKTTIFEAGVLRGRQLARCAACPLFERCQLISSK